MLNFRIKADFWMIAITQNLFYVVFEGAQNNLIFSPKICILVLCNHDILTFTKLVLCLQKKAPRVVFCLVMDHFQSAVLLVQPSRCLQEVSQRDSCRTNCCMCFVRRALGTVCSLRSGERTAHLWQLYPVCFDTSYAVSFNNISVMPTPSHTKHHTHIHIPLFFYGICT